MVSYIAETSEVRKGHLLKVRIVWDHARCDADRIYVIVMVCSCPSFVAAHLKKKKKRKMEKITIWPIFVYMSSDVFQLVCEYSYVQKHSRTTVSYFKRLREVQRSGDCKLCVCMAPY